MGVEFGLNFHLCKSLDLGYYYEWDKCTAGIQEEAIFEAGDEVEFKKYFKGIRLNHDYDETGTKCVEFPVLHTLKDQVVFSFGTDYLYKEYLFPGYLNTKGMETDWALKTRLSVQDARVQVIKFSLFELKLSLIEQNVP